MDYKNGLFKDLKNAEEGIVLLGAGGDIHEWINGVSKTLFDEGIAETKEPEKYVFYLVEHKGVYAALSFDHGMKYIKNGTVYSVMETNEATEPFEESKLR